MSRWLKILLCVVLASTAALGSLPWWLGAALRPALRPLGIAFDRYERVGYAHFRLRGVNYDAARLGVSAQQVETVTPLVWLAQRLRGTDPVVLVENWSLQLKPAHAAATPSGPVVTGLPDLRATLERLGPPLLRWLPSVHLKAGEIRGLGVPLTIASADWHHASLRVDGLRLREYQIALVIAPAADGSLTLTAQTADKEARLQLVWAGPEIKGEAVVWDQVLALHARFPAEGWLPKDASAVAANWRLPASRVRLGAPYAQVQGEARAVWHASAFELSVNARALPTANTKAPPLEVVAAAHGNLRELTLTALHVDAPFATASLSAPVTFSLDHPLAADAAQLIVQADLAKFPWFEARGRVDGTVVVTGNDATARQTFELKFRDVELNHLAVQEARARGVLAWPRMELSQLMVQLDETSALEMHGTVDWQTRELSGFAVQAKLGAAWFTRWLPAGTSWASAEVTATAEGPLATPRHQGSLKLADFRQPPLRSLAVAASWRGTGSKTEITSAHAATEHSAVELSGTLEPDGLQLDKLLFTAADQPVWRLAAPARLTWSPVWQLEPLQLSGPVGGLTLEGRGGPEGTVSLAVSDFDSARLQDWMAVKGPAWKLHRLQATAQVRSGAMAFDTTLTAQIAMHPRPAQVHLVAHGDAHGIELKEFKVVEGDRVLTQAAGRLPLAWLMDPQPHLSVSETAPLELSASTEPDSPLWAALTTYTGLELVKPTAKLNLQGTLRQPVGELQANISRLGLTPGRFGLPLPEFEDLAFALSFGRESVVLTSFNAKVDGQAVQASGQTPMNDARWAQLWFTPAAFDWSEAEGRIEIPGADLAPLARRFPTSLAAQGRLSAHVQLAPGGKFAGSLRLTDAASRPLPPFGALQDVQADLALADHLVTVRSVTAKLGGESVALDGSITLVSGGLPRLALGLRGKNLPLVRNTGLLLRSDLDLRADTDAAGLTRLSGTVTVRDCLVLANLNLRTLLPTGRRGVSRLPPYFAVTAEPFQHWPLAVSVRAPGAIRVRTTVYNGTASAHFQLGGTLGEPRAVGELTVDQGQVLFPFATFKVQQGAVRLREADPFRAVVSLNATAQRRDYQLRLELTGELPAPNATITSTPSLPAADALLLVMTGQPPAGGVTTSGAASGGPRLALLGAYLGRGFFQDLGLGGENRLEVSAGEHVSRQGRETYEFDYKLGERWSLQGEYDQFDNYNAGLKWRVYTEESAPREKK